MNKTKSTKMICCRDRKNEVFDFMLTFVKA